MSIEQLEHRWHHLMHRLAAPLQYNVPLWREIQRAYTAKNRHYHTLAHLADLFQQADLFKKQIKDFDILEISIWYHDIIYQVLKKDSEIKSALFAKYRLEAIHTSRERLVKCYHQINATKLHELSDNDDSDTAFLLDFDLSILGRDWKIYANYANQIRLEYAIIPTFLYKRGRKKVLKLFLEKERIFKTDYYYENFEMIARDNIAKELHFLNQK